MEDNIRQALAEGLIPGTAQIRKISMALSSVELLLLCKRLASEGLDKKLWSVLSRVYEDHKGFNGSYDEAMDECVPAILESSVPAELKLQLFTSFELPVKMLPDKDTTERLIEQCSAKRSNIAGFFIVRYSLERIFYNKVLSDKDIFKIVVKNVSPDRLAGMYEAIIENEKKETITGAIRTLESSKLKFGHLGDEETERFVKLIFESKEVFFTTKLIYCMVFDVPRNKIPLGRELDKILQISINYEEKITKEFVAKYHLRFDVSNEALCKYYIGNKKASNEKNLVFKFAGHLVKIEDDNEKSYLLRSAFKRGGLFRMYAGCMQDGCVNIEKLRKFRYSDEDIEWCKNLPGLK